MEPQRSGRRIFSLNEAGDLLPEVKALTSDAVRTVDRLTAELRQLGDREAERSGVETRIDEAIRSWARAIQAMGLEAKGLWLVDFDNGEGYYCWCYPEETISHYHDYDAGFRGRIKIV